MTGIGPQRASGIVGMLCGRRPDICVATGLAGGLRAEHQSGRILVARAAQSGATGERVACDPRLVDLASRLGAACVDLFVSTDRIVSSVEGKRMLGREADAVDMESFSIVREMVRLGTPVVAVRAVADVVSRELPDGIGDLVDAGGTVRWMRMAGWLARRPLRIPALLRFGMESLSAASELAGFLDLWMEECTRLEGPWNEAGVTP